MIGGGVGGGGGDDDDDGDDGGNTAVGQSNEAVSNQLAGIGDQNSEQNQANVVGGGVGN